MSGAPQNAVQGDELFRVEAMVDADRGLPAVACEGFAGNESSAAYLVVAVGKPAAGGADPQVRMLAQGPADAQF